jgi:hypothetical protein
MIIQPDCQRYHKLLVKAIARLRSVQDVSELWQETANIFGSILNVNQCLILDQPLNQVSTVVAEYHSEDTCPSRLGEKTPVAEDENVQLALSSLSPVVINNLPEEQLSPAQSLLIMAISYNQQVNGLIYLYQDNDCYRICREVLGQSKWISSLYSRYPCSWILKFFHVVEKIGMSPSWNQSQLDFVQQLAEQVGYYNVHLSVEKELKMNTLQNFSQNLSQISEKIRNPLNEIIGSLNLVLDDMLDNPEEQREFIQSAYHSSLKILAVIEEEREFIKESRQSSLIVISNIRRQFWCV